MRRETEDVEEKLSRRMKAEAVGLGLCAEWTADWSDGTDRDGLVRKFVRGIDFCIEHDWPSVDVMKRDFGDVIHRHGVYADENVEASDAPMVVLNGECVGDISYGGTTAGEVYVRHRSEATVRVGGAARAFVSVYDDGEVSVECEDGAKCFVYLHGGRVKKTRGDVAVRDRRNVSKTRKEEDSNEKK